MKWSLAVLNLSLISYLLFPVSSVSAAPVVIDHNASTQFPAIPVSVINQLTVSNSSYKLMLRHASVGNNISSGLNTLQNTNSLYNRINFVFQDRGNPGWQAKVDDLVSQTAAQLNSFNVFTMKLCFIDQNIMDPNPLPGYANGWEYYRTKMLWLEQQYPTKTFIWWTMPIMTSNDSQRNAFNTAVRNYVTTQSSGVTRYLFDMADIESDGLKTIVGGSVTNEVLVGSYSSDGGHLSSLGADRVAKGVWVLMANVTGWRPGSVSPTPTITPKPGDLNTDGAVDYRDHRLLLTQFGQTGYNLFTLNTVIKNFGH
jgi:hypothetical protein